MSNVDAEDLIADHARLPQGRRNRLGDFAGMLG
jgi:hypothetical protein